METRTDAPHPDAQLTARGIARETRRLQPRGTPGMGEHAILAELRAMGAPRVGRWYRVRWGDWLAHLASRRSTPAHEPTPTSDAAAWARDKVAAEEKRATG